MRHWQQRASQGFEPPRPAWRTNSFLQELQASGAVATKQVKAECDRAESAPAIVQTGSGWVSPFRPMKGKAGGWLWALWRCCSAVLTPAQAGCTGAGSGKALTHGRGLQTRTVLTGI